MNLFRNRVAPRTLLLAALLGASCLASAADRRFVPVPSGDNQKLQVINGATIISAAGKSFHAGGTIAVTSSRAAWLSMSVKNTSTVPLPFDNSAIRVVSGEKTLAMKSAEEVAGVQATDGLVRDNCANAPKRWQLDCNIDDFNKKQAARTGDGSRIKPTLPPQALVTRQFELALPKRSKAAPATLKVSVTIEGETIEFDFNEVN